MNSMDIDTLTMTVLVPDTAAAPAVVFDDNAALKLAIVEGRIDTGGKKFEAPSSAASEVKGGSANGWDFWARKTPTGLVRLSTLRVEYRERHPEAG